MSYLSVSRHCESLANLVMKLDEGQKDAEELKNYARSVDDEDIWLTFDGIIQGMQTRYALNLPSSPINLDTIDMVVCTTSQRSIESANLLFNGRDIPVVFDNSFYERDFGDFYICTDNDIKLMDAQNKTRVFEEWAADLFGYVPSGGESLAMVRDRVIPGLQKLLHDNPGKNIWLMTHKVPFQMINAYAHNIEGTLPFGINGKDQYFRFQKQNPIANLAIQKYQVDGSNINTDGQMRTFYNLAA